MKFIQKLYATGLLDAGHRGGTRMGKAIVLQVYTRREFYYLFLTIILLGVSRALVVPWLRSLHSSDKTNVAHEVAKAVDKNLGLINVAIQKTNKGGSIFFLTWQQ